MSPKKTICGLFVFALALAVVVPAQGATHTLYLEYNDFDPGHSNGYPAGWDKLDQPTASTDAVFRCALDIPAGATITGVFWRAMMNHNAASNDDKINLQLYKMLGNGTRAKVTTLLRSNYNVAITTFRNNNRTGLSIPIDVNTRYSLYLEIPGDDITGDTEKYHIAYIKITYTTP